MKSTKVGFETEFFTIDEHGNLVNRVDELIKLSEKRKKINKNLRTEAHEAMVEMGIEPSERLKHIGLHHLVELKELIELGEENKIKLLPLSSYPAKGKITIRNSPWYQAQLNLLGNKFPNSMFCAFHFHYSLPKGTVEKKTKSIKPLAYSKAKEIFLNQYNFLIAADPACITFCQSSPFFQGEHFVKDYRTMLYRDMYFHEKEKELHGLYFNYPILGGLPNYEFTMEDLRTMSSKRKNTYLEMLSSRGLPLEKDVVYSPDLKFMWGAVRVNKVGTFEYRGTDMNHPNILFQWHTC